MAQNRIEELIHPYFDDFDDDVWLHASIDKKAGDPFGFKYGVEKPQTWDEDTFNRVKNHLSVYKLDSLYMLLAACEINKENCLSYLICAIASKGFSIARLCSIMLSSFWHGFTI